MGIFDKVGDVGRGVGERFSNASEVANLRRKILYEEERIVEIFADLGKKYYKNPDEDPAVFRALCEDIDARRRRIKKMKFELNTLREKIDGLYARWDELEQKKQALLS